MFGIASSPTHPKYFPTIVLFNWGINLRLAKKKTKKHQTVKHSNMTLRQPPNCFKVIAVFWGWFLWRKKKSWGKISSANYPMQSKADLNRCSDVQLYLCFATLVINDYFTNCKWHGTRCPQINQIYGYIQLFLLPEIRSSLNMNTFQRMQRHCIMLMKASLNFQWYSCFYICEGKMQ